MHSTLLGLAFYAGSAGWEIAAGGTLVAGSFLMALRRAKKGLDPEDREFSFYRRDAKEMPVSEREALPNAEPFDLSRIDFAPVERNCSKGADKLTKTQKAQNFIFRHRALNCVLGQNAKACLRRKAAYSALVLGAFFATGREFSHAIDKVIEPWATPKIEQLKQGVANIWDDLWDGK